MNRKSLVTGAVCLSSAIALLLAPACGSNGGTSGFNPPGGGSGSGSGGSGGEAGFDEGDGSVPHFGDDDASQPPPSGGDAAATCVNLQCQQFSCGDGGGATLTGHIYDPAGNNPLYKVVAYVPNADPEPIADGITADSCSCGSLYSGTPIADGITDPSGAFTIPNAPVGSNIPLILQIGKWRNYFVIPSVTCGTNDLDTLLPAKLTLPKTQNETKYSNIPNIAISTGDADSLECLLRRVGVDASEYTGTPGALADGGQPGHIHIFAGTPEQVSSVPNTVNPAGPSSSGTGGLWDSDSDINRYDIVLLSCEGAKTGNPNSGVLADYVNGGGRVFASHYHYAFFNTASQFTNVADWSQASGNDGYAAGINAQVETTLANGSPFPEGQALYTWLGNTVGALTGNVDAGTALLPITVARHDAVVSATNLATAWAQSSGATPASTQYFSWDMPLDAGLNDAGQPNYCGRVVFSDLHVGAGEGDYGCTGDPNNCTYSGTTPDGCHIGKLLPDEDAIEFILFDLSSCVTPVTGSPEPPPPVIVPPPPPK